MTKQIVVGYDGSPESREALEWAAGEASARKCRLEILTCYEIPLTADIYGASTLVGTGPDLMDSASEVAAEALASVAATHPGLDVGTRVGVGSATHELTTLPPGTVDMIVLGASSHRGAAATFFLGSTTRAVVRRASCPVVVVRGPSSSGRLDRVVVGVDDSEQARSALRWAAAEADLHEVTLLVVHSWDYPYRVSEASESQARDLTRVDAGRVLDVAVELAREVCGGAVDGELVEGSSAASILAAVRDGDLLVLGSRGRGALRSSLFGSTVNRVLDEAAVPVAVIG